MTCDNALFTTSDPIMLEVGGEPIPDAWWSRRYEYAWATQQIRDARVVADMGAGWMGRPFTKQLASVCDKVYAVDIDPRLKELPDIDRVTKIIGDFSRMLDIPAHSLDAVFCISVLEDLTPEAQENAWFEWRRLLRKGGRVVFTCDVQYDTDKPLGKYPGTNVMALMTGAYAAGFVTGDVVLNWNDDLVHNDDFNLCCFHGVAVVE